MPAGIIDLSAWLITLPSDKTVGNLGRLQTFTGYSFSRLLPLPYHSGLTPSETTPLRGDGVGPLCEPAIQLTTQRPDHREPDYDSGGMGGGWVGAGGDFAKPKIKNKKTEKESADCDGL